MKLGLQHHSGRDPGVRVRWGNLRFNFPMEPSATKLAEPPPPPSCCNEDPGDTLYGVAADLVSFFDKWYGSACKTTVNGYFMWVGCACGDPGVRVATDAKIDEARADLCADVPLIHEVFNYFRDAIVFMSTITGNNTSLRRKTPEPFVSLVANPCESVPCDQLPMFDVKFTPTRRCDYPNPCAQLVSGGTSRSTRVQTGERLCAFHYVELQTITDDIMANGVVQFMASVRPDVPCGGSTVGLVCLVRRTITYQEGSLTECCEYDEPPCDCCLGPLVDISGFFCEWYIGTFNGNSVFGCLLDPAECYQREDDCFPLPLRDNVPKTDGCSYDWETWTQAGASVFLPGSCEVMIPVVHRREHFDNGGSIECRDPVIESTLENLILKYRRDTNANVCRWNEPHPLFRPVCFDEFDDMPAEDCEGLVGSYVEGCCNDGIGAINQEWFYRTMLVDAGNGSCGPSCTFTCPCPGTTISDSTTFSEVPIILGIPAVRKTRIGECGEGTDILESLAFQVAYTGTCPDGGLTNITMRDPRLGSVNATWQSRTVAAPMVDDPACPGYAERTCRELCLIGYGELA